MRFLSLESWKIFVTSSAKGANVLVIGILLILRDRIGVENGWNGSNPLPRGLPLKSLLGLAKQVIAILGH